MLFSDLIVRAKTSLLIVAAISTLVLLDWQLNIYAFLPFAVFSVGVALWWHEWSKLNSFGLDHHAWMVLGAGYVLMAVIGTADFYQREPMLLLWLVLVVLATDVGAYFTGKLLGGKKLAPKISPGKTVSGLIGGVTTASLAGMILYAGLIEFKPSLWAGAAGVLCALLSQGGDLFESWLKRKAGVKDSGSWLPGHGGLFDRLDGHLPVLAMAWLLFKSGAIVL